MKNLAKVICIFAAVMFLTLQNAKAESSLGFFAGLSTPNDEIANVYNSNKLKLGDLGTFGTFVTDGAKNGYHAGIKFRMSLIHSVSFAASAAYHHFPKTSTAAVDASTGTKIADLTTSQDIIPITAGFNLYMINSSAAKIYATGELAYNYNSNDVNLTLASSGVKVNFDKNPSYSRAGAGIGAGIDFNLALFNLNLEAKYNLMNLIGRDSGEEMKKYLSVSLGIYFGSGVK